MLANTQAARVALAVLATAASVSGTAQNASDFKEFQCLALPSEYKEVGSVFYVDAQGMSYRLGKVDGVKLLPESEVGVPTYKSDMTVGAGLLVSTLERLKEIAGWSAKVAANASLDIKVKSSYEGVKLQVSEGQPEQLTVDWFKANRFKVASRTHYYLVREAIRSNVVDYEILKSDMQKLGGEAEVRRIVAGKIDLIDRSNSQSYSLKMKFDKPVNVCIKPQELVAVSLSASGEQNLAVRQVKSPIDIKSFK